MSVIFEAIGGNQIVVSGIDTSLFASAEEWIKCKHVYWYELQDIIQVVSNRIVSKIAKLKATHEM
jgi:hypothetical protein